MSTTTNASTDSGFDISLESIAKAISHLSIEGLGEINADTKLFSHWPSAEQWQSYQQEVAFTILHELPSAEKEAIETNLAAIDKNFNSYLEGFVQLSTQENGKEKIPQVANHLYGLLDRCQSLQKQIYQPTSPRHCTYPYFAHSLILHLAILKSCTLYENSINESQLMQVLLNETTFYLFEAEGEAYQGRQAEIKQERGGARSELAYVLDSRSQQSLTEWCDVSEKFKEIENLYQYLRAKVPLDYVQAIPFAQGYEIVEQLMGNSSDAKAGQDVVEGEQKQWTETVETTWKVAQSSADLLLKYAPQDATQRSLVAARLSDQQEQMIIETTTTLITGVIGSLPIPGAGLIADAYGLLLGWITGAGQTDPWKELEDSLKKYTDEAVLGLELNSLKNNMADIERRFDSFCKDRKNSNWKPGDTLNSELKTRLLSCYDGVQGIQQSLYNPNSQKHTTLPYFERYCTLHFAIMSSVVRCLTSYDIQREYEAFFNETYAYLHGAYSSSGSYRKSKIKRQSGGVLSTLDYVIDEGRTDLTDWWSIFDHKWPVVRHRHGYLESLVPYYFQCQLGIHRMFASYDSLVKIYNEKVGKNLPLLVPVLDSDFPVFLETVDRYMDTMTGWGYGNPGIRYNLYQRRSIEDLKGPRFYEEADFRGKETQLTVGSYPDITKQGISQDSISSVKVPNRWKVTLYEQSNFQGGSRVFTSDTNWVGDNFNDKTSSIKVEVELW